MCQGKGSYKIGASTIRKCDACEGTGKFPSPSRLKQLERIQKEKIKYPKMMTGWDLFLELFR
jgi:hypothetical protein